MHYILKFLQFIAILGCISSTFYYLFSLWAARVFLRGREREKGRLQLPAGAKRASAFPPVSILKPLKGMDPEMYESLRSHCVQDYPEYEIIFGVRDAADDSVACVEQLQREFPEGEIRLIICNEILGLNVKVSNLEQMAGSARFQYLIVNDSDICVGKDYLQRVMGALADPKVGMVTCLYRGVAAPTLGSKLEALGISTDFCAGVLVARELERGLHFGLGSTLAFRRADLERIGGFKS